MAQELYPRQLSDGASAQAVVAVRAAAAAWGEKMLTALEAEDRLAIACEKGEVSDPTILQLRAAYQVRPLGCGGA